MKLGKVFFNAHLETRMKERPLFISDTPIDDFTRKMRLRGRGIPLAKYIEAKPTIESELNIFVAKLENPADGNKELVDIIYATSQPPDFWSLDSLVGYRNFSFPVGKSIRGEIVANLQTIPHYLFAGESGGGKSSAIRMAVTVLLANNPELEVYFFDFKEGMENQVFQGFDNIHLIDDVQDAAQKAGFVNSILDSRMRDFKAAGSRSIESYNQSHDRKGQREKRIIVVVDEISELMPTIGGKQNSSLNEINSIISRIARMGRAVGVTLMIGTQKPDAKNLDPTIKANLMGIFCFPVTHFTQSTIILGNGRAAELNREIPGRAIWKNGSTQVEVQTPFLTEVEVTRARETLSKYWRRKSGEKTAAPNVTPAAPAKNSEASRDVLS
jgi:S-DNA-T family DNA segregation ATPase FtsK/SpoIIIE